MRDGGERPQLVEEDDAPAERGLLLRCEAVELPEPNHVVERDRVRRNPFPTGAVGEALQDAALVLVEEIALHHPAGHAVEGGKDLRPGVLRGAAGGGRGLGAAGLGEGVAHVAPPVGELPRAGEVRDREGGDLALAPALGEAVRVGGDPAGGGAVDRSGAPERAEDLATIGVAVVEVAGLDAGDDVREVHGSTPDESALKDRRRRDWSVLESRRGLVRLNAPGARRRRLPGTRTGEWRPRRARPGAGDGADGHGRDAGRPAPRG